MCFRELFCTFFPLLVNTSGNGVVKSYYEGNSSLHVFHPSLSYFLWIASHQEWIWLVLTSFRMSSVFHWIFRQSSLFEIFYWSLSTLSRGVWLNPTLQQAFLRSQKERTRTFFCKCHSYLALPSGYTLVIKSNHMIWPTSLQFPSFLRSLIGFQIPLLRQDGPYPAIYWVFLNISLPSVHDPAERAGSPSQLSLTSSHPYHSLHSPPAVPVSSLPWLLQHRQRYELFGQHFLGKQVVGCPGALHELEPFLGH